MTFTVELGWWLAPAVITLLAFGAAAFISRDMGDDRFGVGAVIAFGFYLIASVASLASWLVWALAA